MVDEKIKVELNDYITKMIFPKYITMEEAIKYQDITTEIVNHFFVYYANKQGEIDRLRKALEYYANFESNVNENGSYVVGFGHKEDFDCGNTAREALEDGE